MSYQAVDAIRLRYLIGMGTEPGEVSEFFKSCKPKLLAAGATLHRLSDRKDARIEFLARASGKAADVFALWMRKRLSIAPEMLPAALVAQFRALEESGVTEDPKTAHSHARLGLYYLYKESPPEEWIEFLKSPTSAKPGAIRRKADPAKGAENNVTNPNGVDDGGNGGKEVGRRPVGAAGAMPTENDVSQIAALMAGDVTDSADTISSSNPWLLAVGAVARLRQNPELEPMKLLEGLSEEETRTRIAKSLEFVRARLRATEPVAHGLEIRHPRLMPILAEVDAHHAHVVGRCTNETPNGTAAFVEPLAVADGDEILELDRRAALSLFPETGKLIGFPGPAYPTVGEIGLFSVERYQSNQPIKLRIRDRTATIYKVVNLGVRSSEPDAVREAVKSFANPSQSACIFRLSDGLLVRPQGDEHDLRQYNFETPLRAWRSLRAWRIAGYDLVVGPLPPADTLLDCSDLSTVLKSLLDDSKAIEGWPRLSPTNVRALMDYAREHRTGVSQQRLERLGRELEAFVSERDGLSSIVATVLGSEAVRKEIDEAKARVVKDYENSRTDLLKAKRNLEEDLTNLKAARARMKEESKRLSSDMAAAVRKAFHKAQESGVETLAQAAVFSAFVGFQNTDSAVTANSRSTRQFTAVAVAVARASGSAPSEELHLSGIRTAEARSIAFVTSRALELGLSVGFKGVGAGYIANRLGAALSRSQVGIIDVGIGLYSRVEFDEALVNLPEEADLILIRGANSSDFSVYGGTIEAEVISRLRGDGNTARSLIFAFESGPSALPLPRVLEDGCLIIDLGWLDLPGAQVGLTTEALRDALQTAARTGIVRLKCNALAKLLVECDAGASIGNFWIEILARNAGMTIS